MRRFSCQKLQTRIRYNYSGSISVLAKKFHGPTGSWPTTLRLNILIVSVCSNSWCVSKAFIPWTSAGDDKRQAVGGRDLGVGPHGGRGSNQGQRAAQDTRRRPHPNPGPRRPRHLVLVRPLPFQHIRLAGPDGRPLGLLPRDPPRDGARHHLLLGRSHGLLRPEAVRSRVGNKKPTQKTHPKNPVKKPPKMFFFGVF